jgi:hypothetical protein
MMTPKSARPHRFEPGNLVKWVTCVVLAPFGVGPLGPWLLSDFRDAAIFPYVPQTVLPEQCASSRLLRCRRAESSVAILA